MKKDFQGSWKTKISLLPRFLTLTLVLFGIFGGSQQGWASAELDRKYSLDVVGYLRTWDNVDGLFEEYVSRAYQEYFQEASRFVLRDLTRADELLSKSEIPYLKVIEDKEILAQVSRSMRVQTLLRTKVYKEGKRYRFTIDWLHAPKIVLLSQTSFYYDEPEQGKIISSNVLTEKIKTALDELVSYVPFYGHITGRDREWITVNMGENSGVKPGDTLVIGTVEEIKVHPLLNKIVNWEIVQTARLVVVEVEEKLAFCRLTEQSEGREIIRFQKVAKIIPRPEMEMGMTAEGPRSRVTPGELPPKLGWFAIGGNLGNFSRQYSEGGTDRDGGGTIFGFEGEGQLWLTKNFFFEMGLGYDFFSYSQQDVKGGVVTNPAPANSSGSGNLLRFRANIGYSYLVDGHFYGPRGYVRLGYHSNKYTLPLSKANNLGPTTISSVFVGVGGHLPVRDPWGVLLGLDVGLITGEKVEGTTDNSPTSTTDVAFRLGGFYYLSRRLALQAHFDFTAQAIDFEDGLSLTHRVINFVPSLLFYF